MVGPCFSHNDVLVSATGISFLYLAEMVRSRISARCVGPRHMERPFPSMPSLMRPLSGHFLCLAPWKDLFPDNSLCRFSGGENRVKSVFKIDGKGIRATTPHGKGGSRHTSLLFYEVVVCPIPADPKACYRSVSGSHKSPDSGCSDGLFFRVCVGVFLDADSTWRRLRILSISKEETRCIRNCSIC